MTRADKQLPKLRDMDQWVCWGYHCRARNECGAEVSADANECPECGAEVTKPPLSPISGHYYGKSNDSDTWGTYEQATDYNAREDTHTHGVGFMLSSTDMIVGIDLDGCRHPETGELEPWAEDIIDTVDSYTEVSPSGTGLRIFAVGMLPDGGNKGRQERTLELPTWVQENKNAEVEMYDDVRYMTYTGEQLDGTPNEAKQRPEEVKEVHAEYVADETDESDDETEDVDVDLDGSSSEPEGSAEFTNQFGTSLKRIRRWDDKLDSLLSRLEPAYSLQKDDNSPSGYDYATVVKLVYWRFSDGDIKRILRKYRSRDKLDRDDYIRETIKNAKKDQSEQCAPPRDRDVTDETSPDMVRMVLDAILGTYEADEDKDVSRTHREKIWNCVAEIDEDDVEKFADRVIDVLGTTESKIEKHRERSRIIEEQGRIVVEDGKTWFLHGSPLERYELLNFAIDVESYLEIDRGPLQAELALELLTGERFTKAIEPKIFNKKERFDDQVLGESFGTRFDLPNASVTVQECLDELRLWIHHQDAPRRRGVRHMGVYDDELAIPGDTLGPDGWIDEPETVYLEREIGTERRVSLPTDRDSYDEESVAEILETLPYTRETERFLPVLGWFYAAPFRSTIDSLAKDAEFNHLNITGDTGSGKTASLSYLWRCFGMGGEPFSVDMSAYAQVATFSSTNSLPLWFDEYKPSDIPDYKLDRFHDKLRKANKGAFAERGNADKTTSSYQIKAPCVVSGEQSIQGPAERRRTIMTQFRSETTDTGTDTAERFKQLVGKARVDDSGDIEIPDDAPNPDDHALAYYQFVTATELDEVRSAWHDALTRAHRIVSELEVRENLDDLEIQGLQTVAFGFGMYRKFAEAVGADTTKLPSESDLDDALEYVVERIGPKGSRKSHADQFVELFGRAAAAEYVKRNEHYTLVREGQPREELRINLPRSFDALSKYAKDHDLRSDDLLNDHSDYRDRFREMEQTPGSFVECVMQYTPPVSKCTGISTVKAMEQLEFDRSVVTDKEMAAENEAEGSGNNGGGGSPSVDTETAQQQTATTDGGEGPPDGAKGSLADARRLVELLAEQPGPIGRPSLAGAAADRYDMEPDRVERAIDKGLEKGIIIHSQGNLTNNSGG